MSAVLGLQADFQVIAIAVVDDGVGRGQGDAIAPCLRLSYEEAQRVGRVLKPIDNLLPLVLWRSAVVQGYGILSEAIL